MGRQAPKLSAVDLKKRKGKSQACPRISLLDCQELEASRRSQELTRTSFNLRRLNTRSCCRDSTPERPELRILLNESTHRMTDFVDYSNASATPSPGKAIQ